MLKWILLCLGVIAVLTIAAPVIILGDWLGDKFKQEQEQLEFDAADWDGMGERVTKNCTQRSGGNRGEALTPEICKCFVSINMVYNPLPKNQSLHAVFKSQTKKGVKNLTISKAVKLDTFFKGNVSDQLSITLLKELTAKNEAVIQYYQRVEENPAADIAVIINKMGYSQCIHPRDFAKYDLISKGASRQAFTIHTLNARIHKVKQIRLASQ